MLGPRSEYSEFHVFLIIDQSGLDIRSEHFEREPEFQDRLVRLDEVDDPLRPENPDGFFPPVHRHRLQDPKEPDDVIAVEVGDENVGLFVKPEGRVYDRALAALATVEKTDGALVGDRDAR